MAYNCKSLVKLRKLSTYSFVDSSCCLCWLVEVFKCKHWSKHQAKGEGDKHQIQPRLQKQARPSLLPSMHSLQNGRKHRGSKGGEIKHQLRSRPQRYSISILLARVQALDNKLYGLRARISFQRVIRNCNVPCFTETSLNRDLRGHAALHPRGHRHMNSGCLIVFSLLWLRKKIPDTPGQRWGAQEELPLRPLVSWLRTLPRIALRLFLFLLTLSFTLLLLTLLLCISILYSCSILHLFLWHDWRR